LNPANLFKLIKVAPSEKCLVIILSVENTSQRSFTDVIGVEFGLDDYDIGLRDLSGGHVHAQALGVNKLVIAFSSNKDDTLYGICRETTIRDFCELTGAINIPLRDPLINLKVVCGHGTCSSSAVSTFVSWHEPDEGRIVLVAEASVICRVKLFTATV